MYWTNTEQKIAPIAEIKDWRTPKKGICPPTELQAPKITKAVDMETGKDLEEIGPWKTIYFEATNAVYPGLDNLVTTLAIKDQRFVLVGAYRSQDWTQRKLSNSDTVGFYLTLPADLSPFAAEEGLSKTFSENVVGSIPTKQAQPMPSTIPPRAPPVIAPPAVPALRRAPPPDENIPNPLAGQGTVNFGTKQVPGKEQPVGTPGRQGSYSGGDGAHAWGWKLGADTANWVYRKVAPWKEKKPDGSYKYTVYKFNFLLAGISEMAAGRVYTAVLLTKSPPNDDREVTLKIGHIIEDLALRNDPRVGACTGIMVSDGNFDNKNSTALHKDACGYLFNTYTSHENPYTQTTESIDGYRYVIWPNPPNNGFSPGVYFTTVALGNRLDPTLHFHAYAGMASGIMWRVENYKHLLYQKTGILFGGSMSNIHGLFPDPPGVGIDLLNGNEYGLRYWKEEYWRLLPIRTETIPEELVFILP